MTDVWIPTVGGKACLAELDRIADETKRKKASDEPSLRTILADLGSDDFLERARGRSVFRAFFFEPDYSPRRRAAVALPFFAALAAGDDVQDEHELLLMACTIIARSMGTSSLEERIREVAMASAKWFQIVADRRQPAARALLSTAGEALFDPGEKSGVALYHACRRYKTSDARFRHPYGFDDAALRSRPELWVPTVPGKAAHSQYVIIGGPDYARLQSFVRGSIEVFSEGEGRRRARFALHRALRDPNTAHASALAPTMVPFLAAWAAGDDVPDRHKLAQLLGEVVMHSLNERSELHDRVLQAVRASQKWVRQAATTLPPPADQLMNAIDRVAHDASEENDRALRDRVIALLHAFPGGP